MKPMYKAVVNSIRTELATDIDATQTTIPVLNASALQDTKLAVIGSGEIAETIRYESIVDNELIGCERGFQGVAKPWVTGTRIARNFTAYDHDAVVDNINELNEQVQDVKQGVEAITPVSIGAETPQGAQDKADAAKTEAKQEAKTNLDTHLLDYVRQPAFATTSGTASAYTVTLAPVPINLVDGFGITIVPHVANADNPTLNINGLGAIALKDQKGVAYTADKLQVGKPYTFRYVGADFLADSVAGGGGNGLSTLDFSAYTTRYKWSNATVSVQPNAWFTFVMATGKGVLNFVRTFFSDNIRNTPDIRLVVDGVTYNFTKSISSADTHKLSLVLIMPITFETSLLIQLYNNQSTIRNLGWHCTYMLQSGEPSGEQTILTASERRYAVAEIKTASWSSVVSVLGAGYLLGVEFAGYAVPSSSNFSINATVQIDFTNIKANEAVYGSGNANTRHILFNGPIRFERMMAVQGYNDTPTSGIGIIKVYYILD